MKWMGQLDNCGGANVGHSDEVHFSIPSKHLKQIVERQFVLDCQSFNAYVQNRRSSRLTKLLLLLLLLLLLQLLQRLLLQLLRLFVLLLLLLQQMLPRLLLPGWLRLLLLLLLVLHLLRHRGGMARGRGGEVGHHWGAIRRLPSPFPLAPPNKAVVTGFGTARSS